MVNICDKIDRGGVKWAVASVHGPLHMYIHKCRLWLLHLYMGCFTCTWALHMYMGFTHVHGLWLLHMYMGCGCYTCTSELVPSIVCCSVGPSENFSFKQLLQNHWTDLNQIW